MLIIGCDFPTRYHRIVRIDQGAWRRKGGRARSGCRTFSRLSRKGGDFLFFPARPTSNAISRAV
jgi:hypothetical protein